MSSSIDRPRNVQKHIFLCLMKRDLFQGDVKIGSHFQTFQTTQIPLTCLTWRVLAMFQDALCPSLKDLAMRCHWMVLLSVFGTKALPH